MRSLWLPPDTCDKLAKEARRRGVAVDELASELLEAISLVAIEAT
jgi:hypothetical protein